jgi:RNA polymerase sigma-70 factor (ECF subfamily)
MKPKPTEFLSAMTPSFHDLLIQTLPRLRAQAMALTRNRAAADDLVHDAVTNALAAKDSFQPGTNFGAWMQRILRNRFISDVRRRRETVDVDEAPLGALATQAAQGDRLVLKELGRGLDRLSADQRQALLLVVVHGHSYEEVAEIMGCAVGTAKSHVFRARNQLHAFLTGDSPQDAPRVKRVARAAPRTAAAVDSLGERASAS